MQRPAAHKSAFFDDCFVLQGEHVRLEAPALCHVDGLVAAVKADPSLYRWSPVPQGTVEATKYVETALKWKRDVSALPFVTIRIPDDAIIGSARFWNIERWVWPPGP